MLIFFSELTIYRSILNSWDYEACVLLSRHENITVIYGRLIKANKKKIHWNEISLSAESQKNRSLNLTDAR